MKTIAVVICNYNGGMDTVNCIGAVLKSERDDYDIYVIDNASEDNSVELIKNAYGERVTIIQNSENLGGSGGFGRGLRYAAEEKYPYIMMLDNDAYVAEDAMTTMYDYLNAHEDVGIVGAKIMMLDDPNRVMDYAKTVDFHTYIDGSIWNGQLDSEETAIPRDCDFVAGTAAMVKREALIASGGMDEAHFIYYDDIEMNYRIKLAGYRVVSLGTTKAWHKSGMAHNVTNTFAKYYLTKNRYRFFAKYMPESEIEAFADKLLRDNFTYLYGAHYKGKDDIFETTKYIFDDFLHDVRGKAGLHRIQTLKPGHDRLIERWLKDKTSVLIYVTDCVSAKQAVGISNNMIELCKDASITVSTQRSEAVTIEDMKQLLKDRLDTKVYQSIKLVDGNADAADYDIAIQLCEHVKDVKENILPTLYLDNYGNVIASEEDYIYFRNFENGYRFFVHLYREPLLERIAQIRKEKINVFQND